jgi:2-polyprenyl-3-methyl-5-hydroxy-6-metoxy-1,4-benzoquinol methylase
MFKEKDIRPKATEKLVAKLRLKDIKTNFLDNRGNIINNYFLEVGCPSCGRKNNPEEFMKEKFSFKRCKCCNTLYVSPRPTVYRLLKYYKYSKSIKFFTKEILEKTINVRKEKIFKPRAEKVIFYTKKLNTEKEQLIEIGGGNGIFLEVMKGMRDGFKNLLNIEPSKEGARLTKNRGFNVINDFVENVEKLRADCICAFELIEHIFDPLSFCSKVNNLLKENGIFIMTTPNIEGFDLMLLGKDSDNIAAPNHLNYFNPKSIKMLLKKTGFKVINVETPGILDVDIIKNKFKRGYNIKDRFISFLLTKDQRFLDNFQCFLQQNNLSSNMWIVGKKI